MIFPKSFLCSINASHFARFLTLLRSLTFFIPHFHFSMPPALFQLPFTSFFHHFYSSFWNIPYVVVTLVFSFYVSLHSSLYFYSVVSATMVVLVFSLCLSATGVSWWREADGRRARSFLNPWSISYTPRHPLASLDVSCWHLQLNMLKTKLISLIFKSVLSLSPRLLKAECINLSINLI